MMKRIFYLLFILLAVAQLYIPAGMIMQREKILGYGQVFKFKTAPVDPTDIFRGKYITLRFDATEWKSDTDFSFEEEVFVKLSTDSLGFASIADVTVNAPGETSDYVKALIRNAGDKKFWVDYPFDRFYMEESKAYNAEQSYNRASRDSASVAYALVLVLDGKAVVADVIIDGVSVKDLVKED